MSNLNIRSKSPATDPVRPALERALGAARTASDNRATNLVLLDVRDQTCLFDYFLIATGASRRQLHAISEEIDHTLEDEMGDRRLGIEGYQQSRWIVLDYGDIVVHIFDEESRKYYDLENLWVGAKQVDLQGVVEASSLPGADVF